MPPTPPPESLPPPDGPHAAEQGFDRRDLLRGAGAAGASATIAGFWFEGFGNPLRRRRLAPTPAGAPRLTFDALEWTVLEAALERLLPSGPDSPGARDVNAVGYLDRVLAEPEFAPARFRDVVKAGVPVLEGRARERRTAGFAALPGEAQDEVLHGFEQTAQGTLWLKRMLYFALEALLGDPVHGCQPGREGWRWLGNEPPGPRPTEPGWKPKGR